MAMRVLIVDDSKPVRGILAKMLRELDFEVTEAANGQEAIERLRQIGVFQLATVNWNMPVMDGFEFIRAVRADSRFARIPLLVVSGESTQATVARALAAGANDYLVKPVTRQTLTEKLKKLGIPLAQSDDSPDQAKRLRPSPAVDEATLRVGPRPSPASPSAPIRVLIVDDSVVVRGVISSLLGADPDLEVAGTAADGRIALEKLSRTKPDVVLLDIEMPVMNGFETLKELRKRNPRLPIIMFSSLTERGAAATLDALLLGANDYVSKPGGTAMRDAAAGRQAIREELIPKIKQFAPTPPERRAAQAATPIPAQTRRPVARGRIDVVAIGVSTGGPKALSQLLPLFVPGCPVPTLIVQHMPPMFTSHLAKRLSREFDLHAREGDDGLELQPGQVYLAPGGYHMRIKRVIDRVRIQLNQDPPENACRPSADVLFRSVAEAYGAAALAVVLTGMGDDGLRGCRQLHELGGPILVQDEPSSVVWGMPGNVARAGLADKILPLESLGAEITRRVCARRNRPAD
jgi:two-component system chemotaxis response regulator CheB